MSVVSRAERRHLAPDPTPPEIQARIRETWCIRAEHGGSFAPPGSVSERSYRDEVHRMLAALDLVKRHPGLTVYKLCARCRRFTNEAALSRRLHALAAAGLASIWRDRTRQQVVTRFSRSAREVTEQRLSRAIAEHRGQSIQRPANHFDRTCHSNRFEQVAAHEQTVKLSIETTKKN